MWCVTAALICFSLGGSDVHTLKLTTPTKTCNNSDTVQDWSASGPQSWKIDTSRERLVLIRLPQNALLRDCSACGADDECRPSS